MPNSQYLGGNTSSGCLTAKLKPIVGKIFRNMASFALPTV